MSATSDFYHTRATECARDAADANFLFAFVGGVAGFFGLAELGGERVRRGEGVVGVLRHTGAMQEIADLGFRQLRAGVKSPAGPGVADLKAQAARPRQRWVEHVS